MIYYWMGDEYHQFIGQLLVDIIISKKLNMTPHIFKISLTSYILLTGPDHTTQLFPKQ